MEAKQSEGSFTQCFRTLNIVYHFLPNMFNIDKPQAGNFQHDRNQKRLIGSFHNVYWFFGFRSWRHMQRKVEVGSYLERNKQQQNNLQKNTGRYGSGNMRSMSLFVLSCKITSKHIMPSTERKDEFRTWQKVPKRKECEAAQRSAKQVFKRTWNSHLQSEQFPRQQISWMPRHFHGDIIKAHTDSRSFELGENF